MNQRPIVVGLGEILWDLFPDGKQLGGAPANFAFHAQCLGAAGAVVSAVGDDELGREILSRLDEMGLDRSHVAVDAEHPTGTVTVELDAGGKPHYTINERVAWDYIPAGEDLLALARRTDAVCFGSLAQRAGVSRETIRAFLGAVAPGCIRLFDINLRKPFIDRQAIAETLGLTDVLKLSDDELPVLAELLDMPADETDMLSGLIERFGLDMVILTKGAAGSRLRTPQADSSRAGIATAVVDTVGAGDSFNAAAAMGLLAGHDIERINDHANRLAAFVCSQKGATPRPHAALVTEIAGRP
ncbi:MAG: carbohydrate kinase [Phycisphaerae bacterium]|nr:carbohydrate kinase [Phycisphaerae bacterium]